VASERTYATTAQRVAGGICQPYGGIWPKPLVMTEKIIPADSVSIIWERSDGGRFRTRFGAMDPPPNPATP
jgi:hypothetical protein